MKRSLVSIAILILLAQWLAACTPSHKISNDEPPKDYTSFIADLTAAGAVIETAGEVTQPFFSVKGHVITVNDGRVEVFGYRSPLRANAEAARVSPDGYSIGTTQVFWIARSHFYKTGNLIILYVGDSDAVRNVLESVVGPQFAGR